MLGTPCALVRYAAVTVNHGIADRSGGIAVGAESHWTMVVRC